MVNLTFDVINAAWNNIRMGEGNALLQQGIDLSQITIQRVDEDQRTITVMFRGFDQALEDTDRDGPIVKSFILSWLKRSAQTQIARGDPNSFILRITKPMEALPPRRQQPQPAAPVSESLVNISRVRKLNGY